MYCQYYKVLTVLRSVVLSVLRSIALSVLRSIALSVRTYGTRQKKVSGKVHGRDGEASCPTRTTTQRFYRPMPLLSLYLVLSLSSSSFSLDRQLCADTRVYVGRARSTVEVHGRDGEASCSTRTNQRFYRPMPLLSLYLVLSLSSSSFSLDRQLCADMRVYVGHARSTVEVHGRDGEASCSTRTTTQRFYRPMPLLSLYLVLSLSSSSFSLDRQLTSHVLGVLYAVPYPYLVVRSVCTLNIKRSTHVILFYVLNK